MRDKPSVFAFYKGVYIKPGTAAAGGRKNAQLPFFFFVAVLWLAALSVIIFSILFPPFFFSYPSTPHRAQHSHHHQTQK
jgi:hypothetical protein